MGLFNSLTIDESITLPDLPPEINRKTLMFQTKDLDENLMLNFRVNSEKKLEIFKDEGHHVENPDIPFFGMEFVVEKEWWEHYDFTGKINIYESYKHANDNEFKLNKSRLFKFECGWIEYDLVFYHGKLDEIIFTKDKKPVERTDDEVEHLLKESERVRKEVDERLSKNRKDNPTPEQKLIDSIDEITQRNYVIPEIEDYYTDLVEIKEKINEYRNKHDRWYGTAPEQD